MNIDIFASKIVVVVVAITMARRAANDYCRGFSSSRLGEHS